MTQEEKQLLFKVLCEQFPYNLRLASKQLYGGVLSNITKTGDLNARITITCDGALRANSIVFPLSSIKEHLPYLRPMSSMTEEEKKEARNLIYASVEFTDWCNERHLDYRHLIEKGLALEAPEGMYKNE